LARAASLWVLTVDRHSLKKLVLYWRTFCTRSWTRNNDDRRFEMPAQKRRRPAVNPVIRLSGSLLMLQPRDFVF
jgi:hypothetical protein